MKNVWEHKLKVCTTSAPAPHVLLPHRPPWPPDLRKLLGLANGGWPAPHKPCVALTESLYANKGAFPWLKQSNGTGSQRAV